MRLRELERENIIKLCHYYFGKDINLYLFGSRTDDSKKGGDIDLFIESRNKIDMQARINFLVSVEQNITSRKVDLIVKTPFVADKIIFKTAKETGIKLC